MCPVKRFGMIEWTEKANGINRIRKKKVHTNANAFKQMARNAPKKKMSEGWVHAVICDLVVRCRTVYLYRYNVWMAEWWAYPVLVVQQSCRRPNPPKPFFYIHSNVGQQNVQFMRQPCHALARSHTAHRQQIKKPGIIKNVDVKIWCYNSCLPCMHACKIGRREKKSDQRQLQQNTQEIGNKSVSLISKFSVGLFRNIECYHPQRTNHGLHTNQELVSLC